MSLESKLTTAGWLLLLAWLPIFSVYLLGENFGWSSMLRQYFVAPFLK